MEQPKFYKVEAYIRPYKLDKVQEALGKVGQEGFTVCEVKGFGNQKGSTELYRGDLYIVDFLPKMKLEVIVEETRRDAVVQAIIDSAHTGKVGDGIISCQELEVVRQIIDGKTYTPKTLEARAETLSE